MIAKKEIEEYREIVADGDRLISLGHWPAAEARCNDAADFWNQVIDPKIPAEKRAKVGNLRLKVNLLHLCSQEYRAKHLASDMAALNVALSEIATEMQPHEYKAIRETLGLTQDALAERLGVTRETIVRRESGKATITEEAAMAIRSL